MFITPKYTSLAKGSGILSREVRMVELNTSHKEGKLR